MSSPMSEQVKQAVAKATAADLWNSIPSGEPKPSPRHRAKATPTSERPALHVVELPMCPGRC